MKLFLKDSHIEDGMTVHKMQWIKTDDKLYHWRFQREITKELFDRMLVDIRNGIAPVGDKSELAANRYFKFATEFDIGVFDNE